MTADKSLTGKAENVVRAVERTLQATSRRDQPGVKITNLASGKIQVEVHAYDDDLTVAGDRARAEFDRQLGLASVPVDELETLRWYASIGKLAADKGQEPDATTKRMLAERDAFLAEQHQRQENLDSYYPTEDEPTVRDIQAGPGRRRRSIVATGDDEDTTPSVEEMESMLSKLRQVNDSGVEGMEVSDGDA